MGNLMTSMSVGVSGLKVNQSALNTTAHNLANVDTKGYVRQQVLTRDFFYNNVGESHISTFQIGLGTDMAAIRQVRDVFLDKSYRLEIGRQNFYHTQFEAVNEVESLFGELEGEAFQDTLTNFWNSLQELSKEPDSIVKKTSFVDTAITFLERATNISNQLSAYQINLNVQIQQQVNRINEIGNQIKELNFKIRRYESGDEAANDYRDTRNSLLDELGELAKFTYREDSNGVVTVNLEGMQFVTEDTVYQLATTTVSDSSRMLKPIWQGTGTDVYNLEIGYSMHNNTDVGSLKGLLIARGSYEADYRDIPIREKYATEADYQSAVSDYNKKVNPSVIMTVQSQFDQLIHGIVTTINDILSPNASVDDYLTNLGITATATSLVDTSGNPIALANVMLWDEAKAPIGSDADKTAREALFNRKSVERYTEATLTLSDGSTKTVYVYNQEDKADKASLFTLGELEINASIKNNYSKLPMMANIHSGKYGAYDIEVCNKLTTAWKTAFATLDPNTLTRNNFSDYYTAFIGNLASRGEMYENISKNQESMVKSIDSQRQQVAGVSSDEELTNLIRFQHGYNAAARYINVIDEMLEHIVTRL